MPRIKYPLFFLLFLISISALAQKEPTAKSKVYFIHSNKFDGFSTPFDVLVDDYQLCRLNNKHYSIHEIEPGPHTFSANYSMMHVKKGIQSISFSTEPGKTYYVQVIYQRGIFSAKVSCSEITENTAKLILPTIKEDNCL